MLFEEEQLKKILYKNMHNNYIYLDLEYDPAHGSLRPIGNVKGNLLNTEYVLHGELSTWIQTHYFIQIL